MDDTTSRQQIDELADLYLTTPGENPNPPGPVDGPAPIKLNPKLDEEAAPSSTTESIDRDFADHLANEVDDSHPMLRLTEDDAMPDSVATSTPIEGLSTPAEASASTGTSTSDEAIEASAPDITEASAPKALIEAVLLGNLPGMSGPWLTQYAQLLAQTEGPVALLHVGDEAIDLELVEPRAEAQPAPAAPPATVRIPPMREGMSGLVGLIDALVRSEQAPTRTILVRIDPTTDPQTLSRLAALDDWTLLCGGDDASIAAAGQQIRAAVLADPRLADRNVGVMVMGSDESASRDATRRIAESLAYDLANPVELIGHLKRMQPVQVRDLGSFPDPVALWPGLVAWIDTLEVPEPMPTPTPSVNTEHADEAAAEPPRIASPPDPAARPQPTAASRPAPMPRFRQAKPRPTAAAPVIAEGLETPDDRAAKTARPAAASASGARRSPTADASRHTTHKVSDTITAQSVAEPMRPAPTPRVLTPEPELDLVALLAQGPAALDRPVVLDARIPDQPDTQLAVDAEGTVHLLKKGSGVVSEDVMRLVAAGRWVADHLELLALTQRDRDFVDAAPVLHLLTEHAGQLVGKLPGQVRLHLLQQVTLGKETGWFCTPLSA
ncbi:MAG: hypothetical protein ACPGYV_00755 [Phycisphaeraceae bacterium]